MIGRCDRLIVNTEGAARLYRQSYPDATIEVIPNGYDALTPVAPPPSDPFRIVHVGSFYGDRTPDPLLEVLDRLDEPGIEFHHVGPAFPSAARFPRARLAGTVPRARALEHVQSASLLYLKQGPAEGRAHIAIAAKTYEYLATGLPILAEVPPGDNADVVARYASRAWIVAPGDRAGLERAVREAHGERHVHVPRIRSEFVRDFDRARLARRLEHLLATVAKLARPPLPPVEVPACEPCS